jgi:membrane associated rhomboid family serine protease
MNSSLLKNNRRLLQQVGLSLTTSFLFAHEFEGQVNSTLSLTLLTSANVFGFILYRNRPQVVMKYCTKSLLFPCFIHIDRSHLLLNSGVLGMIWYPMANSYGVESSLACYVSAATVVSAFVRKTNPLHVSLGASGAISSLLGAYLWQNDVGAILAPTGVIGLLLTSAIASKLQVSNVDHIAHIVGLLFGVGYCFSKKELNRRKQFNGGEKTSCEGANS